MKIILQCNWIAADLLLRAGAPSATRTRDLLLRRQLLYPLSYRGPLPCQKLARLARTKGNPAAAGTGTPAAPGVARRH